MFASCSLRHDANIVSEAEALMAQSQYEEAYSLIKTIDGRELRPGSELQARYALVYTRGQYKNYDDAASDSLISLAVQYYEANGTTSEKFYAYLYQGLVQYFLRDYYRSSTSLLRALANAQDVEDHYSRGQMFTYLSLINGALQCSEEEMYARQAAQEYQAAELQVYYLNALSLVAQAKLHKADFESCRIVLDSVLTEANICQAPDIIREALILKAHYEVLIDSLSLAESTYMQLANDYGFSRTSSDLGNLALIALHNQDLPTATDYLTSAEESLRSPSDTIVFLINSMDFYRRTNDDTKLICCQDSLLRYYEQLYSMERSHATITAQRDYAKLQIGMLQARNDLNRLTAISACVCLVLLTLLFFANWKKKKALILAQHEKIKYLKSQLRLSMESRDKAMHEIRSSDEYKTILDKLQRQKGLSPSEYESLHSLFATHLPEFVDALNDLLHMSETELNVSILIKLGFNPSDIAILTNKTQSAISQIRARLYHKAFAQKGTPSDWDNLIKSI